VYRAVGEAPPPPGGGRNEGRAQASGPREPRPERPEKATQAKFDGLWAVAEAQVPEWRTITYRVPASAAAPAVFTIDRGDGGQPHLRSTLTLDQKTSAITRHETFSDLSLGRRIRNTMRFAHTGEVLGIPGQTIAGIASAGGAVLVWTGLALAWRRFRSWLTRRSRRNNTRVATAA